MINTKLVKSTVVTILTLFCASIEAASLTDIAKALDLPSNITVASASSGWDVKKGKFSYGDCKNIISFNDSCLVGTAPGDGKNERRELTLTVTGTGTLYFNCVASLDNWNYSELSTADREPQSYEWGDDPYGFSAGGDNKEYYEDSEDYTDFWCPYNEYDYEDLEDWSSYASYSIDFDGSAYQHSITFYLYPVLKDEDYEKPEGETYEKKVYLDCFVWIPDTSAEALTFSPEYDPEFPEDSVFEDKLQVTVNSCYEDATIYYTTDGKEATTKSTVYTGPITLTASTTINALAYTTTGLNVKGKAIYTKRTARPDIAPIVDYGKNQCLLTFSDTESGVTFYYTTDGTLPSSQEPGTKTGNSVTLTENATVTVIASKNGGCDSYPTSIKLDCFGQPSNVMFTIDGQSNQFPCFFTNTILASITNPYENNDVKYRTNNGKWLALEDTYLFITNSAQYDVLFSNQQDSMHSMVLSSWVTKKFDQDLKFSATKTPGQIYLTTGWNTFPVKLYLNDTAKEAIIANLAPRKADGSFASADDLKPGTAFWTYLTSAQLTPELFSALTIKNAGALPNASDMPVLKSGWNLIPAPDTTPAWQWKNGIYSISAPTTDEAIWFKK